MRTFGGKKRQGTRYSTGHQGPVQGSDGGRSTPDTIALAGVGGGDAPHILVDPGEFLSLHQAPELVRPGGGNRIGEVVSVAVALIAVVNPRLRVLMNKERRGAANVINPPVGDDVRSL